MQKNALSIEEIFDSDK